MTIDQLRSTNSHWKSSSSVYHRQPSDWSSLWSGYQTFPLKYSPLRRSSRFYFDMTIVSTSIHELTLEIIIFRLSQATKWLNRLRSGYPSFPLEILTSSEVQRILLWHDDRFNFDLRNKWKSSSSGYHTPLGVEVVFEWLSNVSPRNTHLFGGPAGFTLTWRSFQHRSTNSHWKSSSSVITGNQVVEVVSEVVIQCFP